MLAPPMQHGNYPFFTFSAGRSTDCSQVAQHLDDEMLSAGSSSCALGLATFHTSQQANGKSDVVMEPAPPPPEDVLVGDFVIVDKPTEEGVSQFEHLESV